jgi:hypothetical protein
VAVAAVALRQVTRALAVTAVAVTVGLEVEARKTAWQTRAEVREVQTITTFELLGVRA